VRVAVLAEWYPSPEDPVLGIWAHRQAVAAREAGAEVRVLALRRPVPPLALARRLWRIPPDVDALRRWAVGTRRALRPLIMDGIVVVPVPFLAPPRPISYGSWGYWISPTLGLALDRLHAGWRFDVLHAHCLAPAGHAAARWMARCADPPAFVVSAHGPDMFSVPDKSSVGRRACLAALSAADLVLANSRWAAARCEQIAGRSLPVTVVHLGATVTPGTHAPTGRLRMITVAHLQARKRHDVVLRSLTRLDPERRPDYLVIGDGEQREPLERLTADLGLSDRVRFAGQLPNEQAVARMAESDLFVMPGVEEPFGVAFVEAMAAGIPAIGGRGEGGPEDIAAAGEGLLMVQPGDVDELAGVIGRLSADPAELRRLGDAARLTVEAHFTWDRCGEQTVAAYDAALAARAAR
jgi:glycosyltransferase involved in cell wall biosynthesis